MLNKCEQLWASCAAQALDARLTNHVVTPIVNSGLKNFIIRNSPKPPPRSGEWIQAKERDS